MKKIKVIVLTAIPGYHEGETVTVDVDQNGVPKERFWRRRLSDAKKDNCIEVVLTDKKPSKTKSKSFEYQKEE